MLTTSASTASLCYLSETLHILYPDVRYGSNRQNANTSEHNERLFKHTDEIVREVQSCFTQLRSVFQHQRFVALHTTASDINVRQMIDTCAQQVHTLKALIQKIEGLQPPPLEMPESSLHSPAYDHPPFYVLIGVILLTGIISLSAAALIAAGASLSAIIQMATNLFFTLILPFIVASGVVAHCFNEAPTSAPARQPEKSAAEFYKTAVQQFQQTLDAVLNQLKQYSEASLPQAAYTENSIQRGPTEINTYLLNAA